jgi:hypothetical protein
MKFEIVDKVERRVSNTSYPFADDRRHPINIATVNNHQAECCVAASGVCTCSDERFYADRATYLSEGL